MRRCRMWILVAGLAAFTGCEPEPVATPVAPAPAKTTPAAPSGEKPADGTPLAEATLLKGLQGITFLAPAGWKSVPVSGNIPEAEFALPRADGDAYDGRLTLMSAQSGLEENTARWKSEFIAGEDPKIEKISVDGAEATLVDLRGEWKGTSFRPIDPPRPEHRLISVYIPFRGSQAYYVKVTGPKATIAAHEAALRAFVKSGRFKPEE